MTPEQFNRWSISLRDWEWAIKYATEADKMPINQLAYDALIQMAIISYYRPFSPNQRPGSDAPATSSLRLIDLPALSPEETELHDRCQIFRNKAIAHSEFDYNPTTLTGAGVIVSQSFSVHKIPELDALPRRLIALCQRFIDHCHSVRPDHIFRQHDRGPMQTYTLFVEYLSNPSAGQWHKLPPIPIESMNEEEASRAASAVADVIYPAFAMELLIRIVNGEAGRPIGEIRRPKSP